MAEVGNIHSNSSVNTNKNFQDLSVKNEFYMNELYTELWNNSVLYEKQSVAELVNHTL